MEQWGFPANEIAALANLGPILMCLPKTHSGPKMQRGSEICPCPSVQWIIPMQEVSFFWGPGGKDVIPGILIRRPPFLGTVLHSP